MSAPARSIRDKTLAMAQHVVHQLVQVLAPDCAPLFLTDGFKEYKTAILAHFGYWIQPERRQDKSPMPKPHWMPLPKLLYAQVVKKMRQRRIVAGIRFPKPRLCTARSKRSEPLFPRSRMPESGTSESAGSQGW